MSAAPGARPPTLPRSRTGGRDPDLPARRHPLLNRLWLAATVAFVLALAVAVPILLTHPKPGGPGSPAPGRPPGPAPAGDSVCGLPPGDQGVPRTTPPVTRWVLRGTMAAPTDPGVGPGAAGGGVPYCYAHSPLGVLYAATTFDALHTDPALRAPADTYLTAAGPGRDKLIGYDAAGVGAAGTADFELAGFKVLNYDPASATVDLVFRFSGQYLHSPVALRWEAGDWKVVVPDDGKPFAWGPASLTDYVRWSGR